MDIALLRKRLLQAIDAAKRDATARRGRADASSAAYEKLLAQRAVPIFRAMASALKAEGISFDVMTPSGGVRLVPERAREDGIELSLDTTFDPPRPTLTVVRTRGSRTLRSERVLKEATPIDAITEDDVEAALVAELTPWLER